MPKLTQRVTLLAVACLALSAGLAGAEPGPLDGRKFEGVFIERGKTSGDADTITFKDGRFRSSACDRYGYSDAAYKSASQGDIITFEVETQSPKYGRLAWKGTVRDGKLAATAIMLREGKPAVENWVVAASKP